MDSYKAKWDKVMDSGDVDLFAARDTAYWGSSADAGLDSLKNLMRAIRALPAKES